MASHAGPSDIKEFELFPEPCKILRSFKEGETCSNVHFESSWVKGQCREQLRREQEMDENRLGGG